jgi:hypothetical protein
MKFKGPDQHIYHHYDKTPQVIKIKLERGQKGTYAWEITADGADLEDVRERIREMDEVLRIMYATPTEETK